jgi:hypothetical protein
VADPLESPTLNDISPFMNSFNTVNESLGLLRHVRRNQSGRATGGDGPELPELPPASRILIQNNTGADLDPFRVLAIGAPLQSIADADHGALNFRRQPSFSGTTPTATTDAFCITDEPIDYVAGGTGPLGRAVVQGVVPVDVNVTDAGHGYATPTASDNTKLTSAASGPARILYKPGGTGTLRCVVKLDESGAAGGALNTWQVKNNFGVPPISYAISANTTAQATGMSISIPSAGTYLIAATVVARGTLTGGAGVASFSNIYAYLQYSGGSTGTSQDLFCVCLHGTSGTTHDAFGSASVVTIASFSAAGAVEIYGYRDAPWDAGGGQAWSAAVIYGNVAGFGPRNLNSQLAYLKIA